jgi:hypothetical protein
VQRIFRTLPGKKESFKEAVEALEGYFAPRRYVVAERHKFRSRNKMLMRQSMRIERR